MTMVKEILQPMPAVGTPQATFLATLFATLLARRGRGNFRHRSRYGDDGARTMARQFRRGVDWPAFPQRVITGARDPCSEVIAAPEAACIPTRGTQTCGLGHFGNGCPARAERGLEVSTLAVVEVPRRCACTRAVAQTSPGDDETVARQAQEATRVDGYRQPRREPRHRLPPQVTSQGVDGDLAKQTYRAEAVRLDLHPMTQLRGDAAGRFLDPGPHPQRRGARRQDEGTVDVHDLRRVESLGPMAAAAHLQLYTAVVWHVTRTRQLRLVVVVTRQAPATPRDSVLAATELALDGRQLVEREGARFPIACRFRDSQPFTGLRDCPARAEAALDVQFNAALATLNLARPAPLIEQTGESPLVCSMASWKPRPFHARWLDVCIEK